MVAGRRLDLDHFGAVVRERARADRPDHHRRQVDDTHAVERTAHRANSRSISPHNTPFLSAAQILSLPSFCASPRTSRESPTHSGWTSRVGEPVRALLA